MRKYLIPVMLAFSLLLGGCQQGAGSGGSGSASSAPPEEPDSIFLQEMEDGTREPVKEKDLQEGVRYWVVDPEREGAYVEAEYNGREENGDYIYVIYREPDLSQEELDQALEEVMEDYDAMSVTVAAIEDGVPTVSGAWGWAVKDEIPMTADTKVRAASLSKTSVGLCAMAMAEDGIVSLDAPLSDYWGDDGHNPYSEKQPSIETIMTHTSTLSDLGTSRGLSKLRSLIRNNWRSFEPGNGGYWFYSNFAFCVLGTTLELASDRVLEDYFQERFLQPMGITASLFSGKMEEDEIACLYNSWGGVERSRSEQVNATVPDEIGMGASYYPGGLTISSPDLAKLIAVLANDGEVDGVRYLSEESVHNMETPRFEVDQGEDVSPFQQCLVMRRQDNLLGRPSLCSHTGSAYGVPSLYSYDPDTGDGVVVITVGTARKVNERGLYALCADLSEKLYAKMEGDLA